MMHMTFYWGNKVTILFDCWKTDSWLSYAISLIACFLVATFYQYMEDRRIEFKTIAQAKKYDGSVGTPLLARFGGRSKKPARVATSVLFGVNSAIGYFLMLAVMSFNWGVFIAIVLGLSFGYLFFRTGEDDDVGDLENVCACS